MSRLGRGSLLLLTFAAAAVVLQVYPEFFAENITGRVTHVRDGDTIEVSGVPIRLKGLNCAELATPLGAPAAMRSRGSSRVGNSPAN